MILQPTLTGPTITLAPLEPKDFQDLYAAGSDPLVWQQHPNSNRYLKGEFQIFFDKAMESKGAFKVIENETKKVIGSSRFYEFDAKNKTVMIGYTFLSRDCWGKHFNPEMKKLMLDHAFQFVDTVYFQIGETNIRSQKAILSIGANLKEKFILEGLPYRTYEIKKKIGDNY